MLKKHKPSIFAAVIFASVIFYQYTEYGSAEKFWFFCLVAVALYNATIYCFSVDQDNGKIKNTIIVFLVVLVFTGDYLVNNYGSKSIGSFFQRDGFYEIQYYVNMFPDGSEAKNYRVKADILASSREVGYVDSEGEEHDSSVRAYYIAKAYMPNGGFITFENELDDGSNDLIIGKKIELQDDQDRQWYVELTKERVK